MCVGCVAAGEEGARGVRTPECLTSASSSFGPGRRPGRGPTEPYGGPGRPVHCVLWLPFVGTGPYVFTESVRFWFGCADLLVVGFNSPPSTPAKCHNSFLVSATRQTMRISKACFESKVRCYAEDLFGCCDAEAMPVIQTGEGDGCENALLLASAHWALAL